MMLDNKASQQSVTGSPTKDKDQLWQVNSLNCLPYDFSTLKKLITKTVQESEENARTMSNQNKGKFANNKPIAWPPTRHSLKLLFEALNLFVAPTKLIDALIYSRGPKMEEEPAENFDLDKLVQWFLLNLKTLKHIDYKYADPEWMQYCPSAATLATNNGERSHYLSPLHGLRSHQRYLRKSP